MTIPRNLSKLAEGADTNGVLGATYGGTGLTSPGTSGNVLTSNGTGWTSSAPASVPTGSYLSILSNKFTTTGTSGTGSTATITFSNPAGSTLAASYTFPVGDLVYVQGVTPTGYNGLYTVTASSTNSVSFASSTTGSQTVAGTVIRIPAGYLQGDGSVYSKSSYAALANLIGTPYIPSTPVTTYTNASFYTGDTRISYAISNANNYLFTAGTSNQSASTSATANAFYYSSDGVNWTGASGWVPYCPNTLAQRFVYNGSIYVGIMKNVGRYCIQYSSDRVTWTRAQVTATGANSNYCGGIAYGGSSNVFVINRQYDGCCGPTTDGWYYSTDGANWTGFSAVTGLTDNLMGSIAGYSGGFVVTTISNGKFWYSASGTSGWTDITSTFGTIGNNTTISISYTNGKFFAVNYTGSNPGVWTSTTGASGSWTQVYAVGGGSTWQFPFFWNGSVYANNGSSSNAAAFSPDLATYGGCPYTYAVLGSNFYYKDLAATSIKSWNLNTYNSSTQFPLITLGGGQGLNANYIGGNTNTNAVQLYKT